jgi:hypothetical protein
MGIRETGITTQIQGKNVLAVFIALSRIFIPGPDITCRRIFVSRCTNTGHGTGA